MIDPANILNWVLIAYLVSAAMFLALTVYILKLTRSMGVKIILIGLLLPSIPLILGLMNYWGIKLKHYWSREIMIIYSSFIVFGTIQFSFWLRKRLKSKTNTE